MSELLIKPEDLANRTKEASRTVSLRVQEKTFFGFEKIAKEYNTTANALIAKLADAYIESLSDDFRLSEKDIIGNKKTLLIEYIKKSAKFCKRLSDDTILSRDDMYDYDEYLYDHPGDIIGWLKHTLEQLHGIYDPERTSAVMINDCGHVVIIPTLSDSATYGTGAYDHQYAFSGMLGIPYMKWAIAQHMISSFNRKRNELKLDAELELEDEIFDRIVEAINNSESREKLADNVANVLAEFVKG